MSELALFGGPAAVPNPLKPFRSMGSGEVAAVQAVVESGCLSGFYGSWGEEFKGGPRVRQFEADWAACFKVKHCVSVNSATSGLYAALAAVGVSPGDEVIVPPYTMSATVMGPLVYGAIPVFADIDPRTFCIDLASVKANFTEKTRAIMAVNLFGHPAQLQELRAFADEKGIYLIEDNAQGPFATQNGVYAGTIGHIGIFSLNYHKHIHTGEGGMCVTNDDRLAFRLQMVRNHAENIVEPSEHDDLTNMIGFNYRMTELSAAVGIVQLQRAEELMQPRLQLAERLTAGLSDLAGIAVPTVLPGYTHTYYVWPTLLDQKSLGVSRDLFVKALQAEGIPMYGGYVQPLYLKALFQKRIAIGRDHFPFTLTNRSYGPGLCPVVEEVEKQIAFIEICAFDLSDSEIDQIIEGVRKVHRNRHDLARQAAA